MSAEERRELVGLQLMSARPGTRVPAFRANARVYRRGVASLFPRWVPHMASWLFLIISGSFQPRVHAPLGTGPVRAAAAAAAATEAHEEAVEAVRKENKLPQQPAITAVHGRANRSGWDFRFFQKRGRQNLVRKRASLWPGFVRNLKLVFVPVFTVVHPNLRGWLSHELVKGGGGEAPAHSWP